jgi:hypothetical protein
MSFQSSAPGGARAAGDVARWQNPPESVRIEHWTHAVEQGGAAASACSQLRRAKQSILFPLKQDPGTHNLKD